MKKLSVIINELIRISRAAINNAGEFLYWNLFEKARAYIHRERNLSKIIYTFIQLLKLNYYKRITTRIIQQTVDNDILCFPSSLAFDINSIRSLICCKGTRYTKSLFLKMTCVLYCCYKLREEVKL